MGHGAKSTRRTILVGASHPPGPGPRAPGLEETEHASRSYYMLPDQRGGGGSSARQSW